MADIIDEIFSTLNLGFLEPLVRNFNGIIEPVWAIAFSIAVASLIFGFFGREKGPKLAVIAFLIAFAMVWFGWGDEIMGRLTSGDFSASMDAPAEQQAGSGAADAALGAVSDAEGA